MEVSDKFSSLNEWLISFEARFRAKLKVNYKYAIAIADGNDSRVIRLSPPSNFSVEKLSNFNPNFKDFDCSIFLSWADLLKVISRTQTLQGLSESGALSWRGNTEAALLFHRLILE